ncbi:MAG: DUF4349 domain-containing protein [Cyclobacteriaceae bacterium]|nr:DUF4349 domain-containing protein [Cyclobacteriaceae bacterium]
MRTIIVFVLITALAGCGTNGDSGYEYAGDIAPMEEMEDDAVFHSRAKEAYAGISESQQPAPPVQMEKKIIKTAYLNLQVENLDSAKAAIERAIPDFQAYVSQSDQTNYKGSTTVNMTVRVPSTRLEEFLLFAESQASYLYNKEVSSRDVTEEYIDIQGRLENKRKAEQRFREILGEAKTVEEILKVEEHLRKVTEEIESAQGRLQYLNNQTAMSTVKLSFYQPNYLSAEAPGQSYWSQVGLAFKGGWKFFQKMILGIIQAWPLVLILLGLVWLIRRRVQAYSRQKAM